MSNKGHAIAKLYKTQVSLTEWLDNIHHADTEKIRQEENDKLERLRAINTVIDFPIDDPVQFNPASELTADNPRLKELLATDGDRVCGIRLIPLDPKMPKIRTRGLTVRDSFEWFNQQKVDRTKYYTEFCSHTENAEWSSFFVVNEHGVSGEVIRDRMHHLSQGFYDDAKPIVFHFDFKKWQSEPHDDEAIAYMKSIVARLYVPDVTKQKLLAEKAGAKFVRDYLFGY
ncbi:hypothetical protein FWG95_03350 [Candidatus Saccharibacteria bacterium]|nr:hypothetical protein [Candidatus Saccharibacteria bacterium]